MTPRAIVAVDHLGLILGGRRLFADVGFTLAAGEHLSIIGPNGAGKSTLLRCLLGLVPAATTGNSCSAVWTSWRKKPQIMPADRPPAGDGWTGTIQLGGQAIASLSAAERARLMAHVPQGEERLPPFSLRSFVSQGRYARPEAPQAVHDAIIERSLAETGLLHLGNRPLAQLSGGERQKAFLAAALVQEPEVLVLDEPAAYLDPAHEQSLRELLERLRHERKLAVISVSHNLNSVLLTNGAVLALHHGQARLFAHSRELAASGVLDHIFDARFATVHHPHSGEPLVLPDRPANPSAGGRQ